MNDTHSQSVLIIKNVESLQSRTIDFVTPLFMDNYIHTFITRKNLTADVHVWKEIRSFTLKTLYILMIICYIYEYMKRTPYLVPFAIRLQNLCFLYKILKT